MCKALADPGETVVNKHSSSSQGVHIPAPNLSQMVFD